METVIEMAPKIGKDFKNWGVDTFKDLVRGNFGEYLKDIFIDMP